MWNKIKNLFKKPEKMSDGQHTFEELYQNRYELVIALAKAKADTLDVWRTETTFNYCAYIDRFILGIGKKEGEQITYLLPMSLWEKTDFAKTLKKAPKRS